jgi:hypothetical protein
MACDISRNQPVRDALIWLTRPEVRNQRVQVFQDCRFENGLEHDKFQGGAAGDAGRGIIAQGLRFSEGGPLKQAIVVDCNTKKVAWLGGPITEQGPTTCGWDYIERAPLLKPEGVLDLREGANFEELLSIAKSLNVSVEVAPDTFTPKSQRNSVKLRDRVDPFCGCKIFYPDSAGAQ